MQFLYRWLIYGNFWIAFGAVGLTYANSMMIYNQVGFIIKGMDLDLFDRRI